MSKLAKGSAILEVTYPKEIYQTLRDRAAAEGTSVSALAKHLITMGYQQTYHSDIITTKTEMQE